MKQNVRKLQHDKGLMVTTKPTYPLANTFNNEVLPLEPSPLKNENRKRVSQRQVLLSFAPSEDRLFFFKSHSQQDDLALERLFSFT